MSNPTSNYNFQMPTNTDLVSQLPADFEVFGQAVDTRLKALQPGTTLGDISYSSATANTNTRLGIGSTGNVLTVAGGVPTWAAPAAGGAANWTLLNTGGTTLSGSATISVGSISGKDKILILVKDATIGSTAGWGMRFRLNLDTGTNYDYSYTGINNPASYNTGTVGGSYNAADDAVNIGGFGSGTGSAVNAYALITGCNTSGVKVFQSCGNGTSAGGGANNTAQFSNGFYNSATTISSISITTGVSFTGGTVFVYTSA